MTTYDEIRSPNSWLIRFECDEYEWVHRAHTVGLCAHGQPELAIDALPYADEPSGEMEFGPDAMAKVLDEVALRWQTSPLQTGRPIEVEAYKGWSILVDPSPGRTITGEATAPDAVELRWKLAPPPPPTPVEVGDEHAMAVRLGVVALESCIKRPVHMPGLELADHIEFGQDQTYGPLTPWVVANARAMLGLDHVDVVIARMESAAAAHDPNIASIALTMTAEQVVRSDGVERIGHLAQRVSRRLQERKDWGFEVQETATELGMSRQKARDYLGSHLGIFVTNALAACALEDVMTEQLTLCSLGGWRSIVSPTESDPGDLWRCEESTTATLTRFFANLDEDGLVEAIQAIDEAEHTEVAELRLRLIGSTLVRKASPPPQSEIVGPGLRDVLSYRGGRSYVDQLARLVAALCQPPFWLSDEEAARQRAMLTESIGISW